MVEKIRSLVFCLINHIPKLKTVDFQEFVTSVNAETQIQVEIFLILLLFGIVRDFRVRF